ncbi:AraC family transcriptional regulator [Marinobacterium maritimum]|uniref:AraC family transcriptional regulator n=1 Tax=Marinobacterium maritimum TaxID=500162 RepID=A0ABN1I4L2_9GAMM
MNSHNRILKARSSVLTGFTEHCRRHQVNPMHLLASENLAPAVLRSSDLQIPYENFVRVLHRAAAESGYPLFSLTLSLRHGIEALGPLGLMASQCSTLGDSLAIVQKYMDCYAQGVDLKLELHGKEARLVYDVHMELDIELTQLMEIGIGRIYNVVKALGAPGMPITAVSFRHVPLTNLETYTELLGVEPRFNADINSVSFPAPYLKLPPAPASERVRGYFESFLKQAGHNHSRPLKQQVIRLIHELIPTGEASADSVARLLGMHTRSLQRQLKLIDTDFRTLLEEVRYELAQDALRQPDTPLTDLALQLGYSELSAFSRAFKRWSGRSPLRWREEHAQAVTAEAG